MNNKIILVKKQILKNLILLFIILTPYENAFPQKIISSVLGCSSPQKEAVIVGQPYIVPAIPMRIIKSSTGEPLIGAKLNAHYIWEWYMYPANDHPFGVGDDACDYIEWDLGENKDGLYIFPTYTVKPRGWNLKPKNIATIFKNVKPRFTSIEFDIESKEEFIDTPEPPKLGGRPALYSWYHTFTVSELNKLTKNGLSEIVIKVGKAVRNNIGGTDHPNGSVEFIYKSK